MKAVARHRGAPSAPIRVSSLALAVLATGVPLFLLILGLSIQTYRAMRERQLSVDLIPVPEPPPPEQQRPEPARHAEREAAPAPAAPRPAAVIDRSAPILPQPLPQPPAADLSGSGTATTPGTGSGGSGTGGSGSGTGGTAVRAAPVRVGASWVTKPGTPELMPFNPPMARAEGVNGRALLSCRVLRDRTVADCRVVSEAPRGYGFGKAALKASTIFRLNPPTIDGEPDEARRVEIPVAFNNKRR